MVYTVSIMSHLFDVQSKTDNAGLRRQWWSWRWHLMWRRYRRRSKTLPMPANRQFNVRSFFRLPRVRRASLSDSAMIYLSYQSHWRIGRDATDTRSTPSARILRETSRRLPPFSRPVAGQPWRRLNRTRGTSVLAGTVDVHQWFLLNWDCSRLIIVRRRGASGLRDGEINWLDNRWWQWNHLMALMIYWGTIP